MNLYSKSTSHANFILILHDFHYVTDMTFKYFPNVIGIIISVNEPYGLCKHRDNPGTLAYVSLI